MNENIETVKSFYAALPGSAGGTGDQSSVFAFLSPDIDWTIVGPPDIMPYAGRRMGHEGVGEYFAAFDKSEVVKLFEPNEFFAQENTVIVLGRYRGMVKATANEFEFEWVHVFRLSQGKITNFCEHADTAAAVKAFQE